MPIKSAKQFRFMQAMKTGAKKKGNGIGPSPSVAQEFINKTPFSKRKQFAKINGIGPSEALMRELIKRKIPPIELRRQPEFRKKLYGLPKLGPKLK
jgi:hypothetical protein